MPELDTQEYASNEPWAVSPALLEELLHPEEIAQIISVGWLPDGALEVQLPDHTAIFRQDGDAWEVAMEAVIHLAQDRKQANCTPVYRQAA